jgi:creatinine amidohydrolase
MRTVQFEYLRPHELLEEQKRVSIVYLPVGPLEWHGPAMPYGTDPLAAAEVARRAARITGGVVIPPLFMGTERERSEKFLADAGFENTLQYIVGMDVPNNSMKSFYTPEEIFAVTVREYLRLLSRQGYKLIVIVNGHGATGQVNSLERLAVEFSNETKSRVFVIMGIAHYDPADEDFGHATRLETSIQMALQGDNVDLSRLPDRSVKLKSSDWGIMDGCTFAGNPPADKCVVFDPRNATAEMGEKYLEASAKHVASATLEVYKALS